MFEPEEPAPAASPTPYDLDQAAKDKLRKALAQSTSVTANGYAPSDPRAAQYGQRVQVESAIQQAQAQDAREAALRAAAARTNQGPPPLPMLPEEQNGGLAGMAAYNRRKQAYMADWAAKNPVR